MINIILAFFSLFLFFSFVQSLAWKSIFKNLTFSKLYYEESSWFDTKIWQKSNSLIRKENLFAHNKIKKKFINKSKKTKGFLLFVNSLAITFYILLSILKELK